MVFSESKAEPQLLNGIELISPCFVELIFIYDHVLCEETLLDSLKKTLHNAPYITGRVKDIYSPEPLWTANDEGLPFIVDKHENDISCFTASEGPHLERIRDYRVDKLSCATDENTPVLHIRLSLYNNSSILTLYINHLVFDFLSILSFFDSWTKVARGEAPEKLVFDRQLIRQRSIGECDSTHPIIPAITEDEIEASEVPKISNIRKTFRVKADTLAQWINDTNEKDMNYTGIKYCLLPAYLLELSARHRIEKQGTIKYTQVNNYRSLLGISRSYIGNAAEPTFFEVDFEEFSSMSSEDIAKKIWSLRDTLAKNPEIIGQAIGFWSKIMREGKLQKCFRKVGTAEALDQLYYNDASKTPVYELNFGTGNPVWFEPTWLDHTIPFRYFLVFPAPEKNGDLILYTLLPENEMNELSKHFETVPGS